MLKKLVPTLALASLAFGSGLCFNPYNHDYGVSTEKIDDTNLSNYNKTIVLHNGKMQIDKDTTIELVRYTAKDDKALVLMRGEGSDTYFVVYTECINGKPVTKDVETISSTLPTTRTVDVPEYPIKLGFYKDGFWVKALDISWIRHMNGSGPGGYACEYNTHYFPYKLIKEGKGYDGPTKFEELPARECNN
jgi:hypothetical protein